jgi:hypothetical protein
LDEITCCAAAICCSALIEQLIDVAGGRTGRRERRAGIAENALGQRNWLRSLPR